MKILFVRPQPSPDTIGLQHIMVVEPLELEVLAAVTSKDDECMIADMILEEQSLDKIIINFEPDVFCVTGYITHMQVMKECCRTAKSILPNVATVVGGVHVEKFPEDVDDASIDFRVVRNATKTFADLINHLKYKTALPASVLKFGEQMNEAKLPDYDFYFPIPNRQLTAKYRHKYFYVFHQKVALMKTSFGCPYTCKFCFCRKITGDHYYARPMDDVIAELKMIKEREVYIVDDDFLLSASRLKEFIKRLRQEKIKKNYLVFGRANFIAANKDIIGELYDVGLRTVIVGIESFDNNELDSFEKRSSSYINQKALEVLKTCNVDCYAAVITSPGWSKNDFKKVGNKLLQLGIKFINLQPLTPLKGTAIEVSEEDLVIKRNDFARWDLAHVVIRPEKMSVKDYYANIKHLYERILFNPRNLFSHFIHHPISVQWKLAKGLIRVSRQYRNCIQTTPNHYAKNIVHTADTIQ